MIEFNYRVNLKVRDSNNIFIVTFKYKKIN